VTDERRGQKVNVQVSGLTGGAPLWTSEQHVDDNWGPTFLQTSHIRKLCEVPGAVLASYSPSEVGPSTFHGEEPVWPDGWDRMRRAAAGADEPDEEAPPAVSSAT
jgi:hypothetical protein